MKQRLLAYLTNNKHYWWTVSVIPGVYTILYLYTNNYTLLNSWYQLGGLALIFIALPVAEILVLDFIFKKWLSKYRPKLYWNYLIINFAIILSFAVYFGWRWKGLALVALISIVSSYFIAKHYKKLVILLGIMTSLASLYFGWFYLERIASWEDWTTTQSFEKLEFKKKPNIYLIQADGFVSETTANNELYQWLDTSFYRNIESLGLSIKKNYRSNYPTTLTSNSALFTGQHHYFENGRLEGELYNGREYIMGNNATLRTLKSNGYELNAILEHSYLMLNHPKIGYDRINVTDQDIGILPDYLEDNDFEKALYEAVTTANDKPQFYFVEILQPGHVAVNSWGAATIDSERESYLERINEIAPKLERMIDHINKKDSAAIILLLADHGGFVGFKSTEEAYRQPTQSLAIKQSIFGSLFAIKAADDFEPYLDNVETSIGVFNNLFHYLAAKPVPKDTVDNSSYIYLKKGDAQGVHTYYNTNGQPLTKKIQF